MIEIYVNAKKLELPSNLSISFKKENILFAFDNIKCERTTSFSIPVTPNNDSVFGLARDVATTGEAMRRRFNATMVFDAVTKDGYLYVESFSGGNYKGVFVTGELLGLQKIKSAGKLKDILSDATMTETADLHGYVRDAYTYRNNIFSHLRYRIATTDVKPSLLLSTIVTRVANILQVPVAIPSYSAFIRHLIGEPQGATKKTVTITRTKTGDYTSVRQNAVVVARTQADGLTSILYPLGEMLTSVGGTYVLLQYGKVSHLTPFQSLKLTFPTNTPSDIYIGRLNPDTGEDEQSTFTFLGDYSFVNNAGTIVRTGEPLAGRTISIPHGQDFMFIRESDYVYRGRGLGYHVDSDLTVTCEIEGDPIEDRGETLRSYDNLPDIDFVQLLKIYAYVSGTLLNYTDADGVTFEAAYLSSWQNYELQRLISIDDVSRTFSNYARRNIIKFKSGDNVPTGQRVTTDYVVDNDNIDEEKTLAEIPYSEGVAISTDIAEPSDSKNNVLVTVTAGKNNLQRVNLMQNSGLLTLCAASTSITAKAQMSLIEYEQLPTKCRILIQNTPYVWTAANWSKGIVTLNLSKIE